MSDYELALEIAKRAHKGVKDKAGADYIQHPITVAERVGNETEKTVALLHDIAEDTKIGLDALSVLFNDSVINALKLLTHDKSVPYSDYINNIKNSKNIIAIHVKLADLSHNMELNRLPEVTQTDLDRYEKYKKSAEILKQSLNESDLRSRSIK